jgi:hypothetical protein
MSFCYFWTSINSHLNQVLLTPASHLELILEVLILFLFLLHIYIFFNFHQLLKFQQQLLTSLEITLIIKFTLSTTYLPMIF